METNIQKYPNYKDSGAEWLGDLPIHWESIKMKHLFQDVSIKKKADAELLSVTQDQGVVPRTWVENRMVMPSGALESFKFINKGDFAISLRSFEGGLEYCHHDGIISPAYTVLKAKRTFESQFYKYLFKSFSFISELQTSVVGIRQGKNISFEELSYSYLPIPPFPEQTAIAAFLDRKTALIDQAIGIKQKQIELLKERRQILIHNAVTRGLNPNVKMKDSGVEWIGEIPESWEVSKLGYLTYKIGDGLHGTPNYTDETEFYFINGNNLGTGYIEITEQTKTVSEREYSLHKKDLTENTLLLSINGTIGNVAFYQGEKVMLGKSAAYLNFYSDLNIEFIKWFLESSVFKNYYELQLSGSTINNFSLYSIGKTPIILPSKNEQKEIVEFLKSTSSKIATAISLKVQEIEKLKEYKATLINSAVTGKIKVC